MVDLKVMNFEDSRVWQNSLELTVDIYAITKSFPKDEQFGLTSQIRRASSSVGANIAEGFGRMSTKDKLHFYTMSYGSLLETKNFLYLAHRLGYVELPIKLFEDIEIIKMQINAIKRAIK